MGAKNESKPIEGNSVAMQPCEGNSVAMQPFEDNSVAMQPFEGNSVACNCSEKCFGRFKRNPVANPKFKKNKPLQANRCKTLRMYRTKRCNQIGHISLQCNNLCNKIARILLRAIICSPGAGGGSNPVSTSCTVVNHSIVDLCAKQIGHCSKSGGYGAGDNEQSDGLPGAHTVNI